MPIYEFECEACEETKEIFVTRTEQGAVIICESCGRPMKKVMSLSSFILKGSGWAKDLYTKKKT